MENEKSSWSSWAAYLIVLFILASALALTGCHEGDTQRKYAIDQCAERDIFTACVQSGGDVKECRVSAGALAYTRVDRTKPECDLYR